MSTGNIRWFQIDSWHLIKDIYQNSAGVPTVETRCGLKRMWDGTFLDHLPGGDEKSCENCLLLKVADEKPVAKRTRKTK